MAGELKWNGAPVKVDSTTVARVSRGEEATSQNLVDVTGSENTQVQKAPTIPEQTYHLEGTALEGTSAAREAGQTSLRAAVKAGTQVVIQVLDDNGYGYNMTGYLANWKEGGANADVFRWSADFHVNSEAAVTPA